MKRTKILISKFEKLCFKYAKRRVSDQERSSLELVASSLTDDEYCKAEIIAEVWGEDKFFREKRYQLRSRSTEDCLLLPEKKFRVDCMEDFFHAQLCLWLNEHYRVLKEKREVK